MKTTSAYKKMHGPNCNENAKTKQCYFIPKNKDKIVGSFPIICRSSWETKFANWADINDNVVRWGSECVSIQYRDPSSINITEAKKVGIDFTNPICWPQRNYYMDFYLELRDAEGNIHKYLIEIKPFYQTQQPIPPKKDAKLRDIRAYNSALKTWLTNDAKWKAATIFAKEHDMEFVIYTENTLKKLGLL